jgi:hypothetical protein
MAIKAIVDTLDDVPEAYRDLYTEVNGKFEVTGIEDVLGLSAVKSLKTENGARRIAEKKAKDELAKWSTLADRKPEDIIAALNRVEELELAAEGKLDDAKINEMVQKRLGHHTGPLQRKLDEALKANLEKDGQIETFTKKERTRTIHDSVREAVAKAQGFQAAALEDALLYADRHFELNEDGKVVTKDGVGVTPGVDAVVWMTEMQTRKPHWWGETKGGGGGGGGRPPLGGVNPFSKDGWNLTEQGKLLSTNRTRAEQLAKAAGTTIGGKRPLK